MRCCALLLRGRLQCPAPCGAAISDGSPLGPRLCSPVAYLGRVPLVAESGSDLKVSGRARLCSPCQRGLWCTTAGRWRLPGRRPVPCPYHRAAQWQGTSRLSPLSPAATGGHPHLSAWALTVCGSQVLGRGRVMSSSGSWAAWAKLLGKDLRLDCSWATVEGHPRPHTWSPGRDTGATPCGSTRSL